MDDKENIRRQVWMQLHEVAKPDSRFHWDFNLFIPDFEGSAACVERLCNTIEDRLANPVLVVCWLSFATN